MGIDAHPLRTLGLRTLGGLFIVGFVGMFAHVTSRATGHEHGPIARARAIGLGDSEAKVRQILGKPSSVRLGRNGESDESFEALGERVLVEIDANGVVLAQAYPDIKRPSSSFFLIAPHGIFPTFNPKAY